MKGSEEGQFLHDLASPIGAAIFVLDMLVESMQARSGADAEELKQATQAHESLLQAKKLLEERRRSLEAAS